ncbi:MAG: hypothetical protein R2807_04790 [Chitinophagales bacterium]
MQEIHGNQFLQQKMQVRDLLVILEVIKFIVQMIILQLGWQVYANSQLDHYLKLRCTKLKSAYGTVEITEGIESVLSSPRNTGDNITHFSACQAGTFIKGLSIYANTY